VATLKGPELGAPLVEAAPPPTPPGDTDGTQRNRFFAATVAVTLAVSLGFLVRILLYTHGHLVYVIDDPGIHLAMARNLAEHGTWGVSPGVYESASSSPLWTLMLAGVIKVASPLGSVAPLVGNLVAGVWILWIFASRQRFPVLAKGNWGSWVFVIVLPLCGLFLPGLAYTGMEHTLHSAVALMVVVLLAVLVDGRATKRQRVAYFAFLAIASCLRLETMFLAAGCGAALLVATTERLGGTETASRWTMRRRIVDVVGTGLAAGIPVLVIGGINKLFHRRFFPNSVVAKTALGKDQSLIPSPLKWLDHLNQDPLLAVLVVLAVVYVVFVLSGFPGRNAAIALAFAVTGLLHVAFASIGWYERYQAYLIIIGIFVMLRIGAEVIAPRRREAALFGFAIALIVFSVTRVGLLTTTPLAASNTYRQQYQVGRFMQRYYDGKAIAVQDLGYISFLHDGPVVDLNGLGSHEVLDLIRDKKFNKRAMGDVIARNHVQAIALYAAAYVFKLPNGWVPVGSWSLGQRRVSPLFSTVTFFAPSKGLAGKLDRRLRAFRHELPAGVKTLDRSQLFDQALKRLGGVGGSTGSGSSGSGGTPQAPSNIGGSNDSSSTPAVPG
jgi:hypothetical protein